MFCLNSFGVNEAFEIVSSCYPNQSHFEIDSQESPRLSQTCMDRSRLILDLAIANTWTCCDETIDVIMCIREFGEGLVNLVRRSYSRGKAYKIPTRG